MTGDRNLTSTSSALTGPPLTPDEVTAPWLAEMLAHVITGPISSIDAVTIGTGQVGSNVRFRLFGPDGQRLGSVVGKFPSPNPVSFQAGLDTGVYHKEIGFYRDLQSTVTIRTPALHYLGHDPATMRFCFIMEDVAPAETGDQLAGTDLDTARRVVAELAGLHAPTRGRAAELRRLDWIEQPDRAGSGRRDELVRALFDGFVERYDKALEPEALGTGRRLVDRLGAVTETRLDAAVDDELCLTHGDYRLDNLLFGRSPEVPDVVVVDWQTCRLGSGPDDLAYFCGAGLDPGVRAVADRELVAAYRHAMADEGVALDPDELWDRYRLGSVTGYLMAVVASMIVERTERGDAMFMAMANRHAAQMNQLDFFDLIG